MIFNKHSRLEGQHALLSASKYHWLNYDDDKLERFFDHHMTAARGTKLHDYAKKAIDLEIRQKDDPPTTLSLYINDAIDYEMTPEQVLFYTDYAFGTADAVSYWDHFLRIHDLKNGESPASFKQLYTYAGYFCLEYDLSPIEINGELRIYQHNQAYAQIIDVDVLTHVVDRLVYANRRYLERRKELMGR